MNYYFFYIFSFLVLLFAFSIADPEDDYSFLAFVSDQLSKNANINIFLNDPSNGNKALFTYHSYLGVLFLMRKNWRCANVEEKFNEPCNEFRIYVQVLYDFLSRIYLNGVEQVQDMKPQFCFEVSRPTTRKFETLIDAINNLSKVSTFLFDSSTRAYYSHSFTSLFDSWPKQILKNKEEIMKYYGIKEEGKEAKEEEEEEEKKKEKEEIEEKKEANEEDKEQKEKEEIEEGKEEKKEGKREEEEEKEGKREKEEHVETALTGGQRGKEKRWQKRMGKKHFKNVKKIFTNKEEGKEAKAEKEKEKEEEEKEKKKKEEEEEEKKEDKEEKEKGEDEEEKEGKEKEEAKREEVKEKKKKEEGKGEEEHAGTSLVGGQKRKEKWWQKIMGKKHLKNFKKMFIKRKAPAEDFDHAMERMAEIAKAIVKKECETGYTYETKPIWYSPFLNA